MLTILLCVYALDTNKGWHDQFATLFKEDHQTQQDAKKLYMDKKSKERAKKATIDDNVALSQGYVLLQKKLQKDKKERAKYLNRYEQLKKPKKTSASIMGQSQGQVSAYAKKNNLLEKMRKLEHERQNLGSGHVYQSRKHQIGKELGEIRKKLESIT